LLALSWHRQTVVAEEGLEQAPDSPGETKILGLGGAKSGALGAQLAVYGPNLAAVDEAWDSLPEEARVGILALVKEALSIVTIRFQ